MSSVARSRPVLVQDETSRAEASAPREPAPARSPRVSAPKQPAPPKKRSRLTPASLFAIAVVILLIVGWLAPTERYLTPKRGLGYALGITGGSMMLLLFLYSARKRFPWLKFLGRTTSLFRFHMTLGVLGPLCILYHSNFSLGASNSNVALFSMLTVAGSGLVGRYIYARIHHGLYGHKLTLTELRENVDGVRALSSSVGFLPELVDRLESLEKRLLEAGPHLPVLGIAKLLVVASIALVGRWQLHRYIRKALRIAARNSSVIAAERQRLRRTARAYVDKRVATTRRVAEFQSFERLFSLWHALHLPLIVMLIAAGVVHVVAVNVY